MNDSGYVAIDSVNTQQRRSPQKVLQVQSMTGTISELRAGAISSFRLRVLAESDFARMTRLMDITVYLVPATQLQDVTIANGALVRVRGLLLIDPGTLSLVAQKISCP